ncbi:hypothetical protein COUCH_15870 [Couchioplanes caeruleus]|uniref:hypothetical protein n=1 Tax=Couchioplanes caeruleus TaxID=56438 RepID=UPI0020BE3903|nr:hypothetical protein [Couchioplanes caeruleus]UQU67654.1 hypothetical protein COUCH_15870 [Couchioplanes caeruleus]
MATTDQTRTRWHKVGLQLFRSAISAAAVVYLFQAVSAGQFLDGGYDFLRLHQLGTTVADGLMALALIATTLMKWGRGSLRPFLGVLATILVSQAQAACGAARMVWLHVPLGVLVIGLVWVLAWFAWTEPAVREAGGRPVREDAS